jgi:uncharacterized protein
MTKIGLLSDTHGHLDERLLSYFKDVDEIWHAGDIGSLEVIDTLKKFKPLRIVYGNIDNTSIRSETDEYLLFEVEGKKIGMTHIAGRPGKVPQKVQEFIQINRPDIFVCGHSHVLLVQFDQKNQLLWLNPGACGVKGFHPIRTMLRFEIHEKNIQNMEVIELGKRSQL